MKTIYFTHYKDCTFSWKPERSVPSNMSTAATSVAAPGEAWRMTPTAEQARPAFALARATAASK